MVGRGDPGYVQTTVEGQPLGVGVLWLAAAVAALKLEGLVGLHLHLHGERAFRLLLDERHALPQLFEAG